eukprot:TRINITY_DN497_c0_g1_i1.p1 TRINITY_DN497_c0_g1~~TRINITY_DN497_c0_g1_i1.p1  ORF type:complete len:862 (-),score=115.89 TRINITY_DN497_c0_g1_i1:178-2763(-)
MVSVENEALICEENGRGIALPFFSDEWTWSSELRTVLYFVGLVWLFVGVGEASDVFMNAIEAITAKTKQMMSPNSGHMVRVKVWNPTVANLTLMALGSSAPEILLSVIELLGRRMYSGELGPSTIVGSAAFNLLCIIAICVSAIPDGEVRKIKLVPVYCVTASFSIFAYVWLVFILLGTSPHIVEVWEGLTTFVFFFVLVLLAYLADRGRFGGVAADSDDHSDEPVAQRRILGAEISAEELAKIEAHVRKVHGAMLGDAEIIRLIEAEWCGCAPTKPMQPPPGASRRVAPIDAPSHIATDDPKTPDDKIVAPAQGSGSSKVLQPQGKASRLNPPRFGFAFDRFGILEKNTMVAVKITRLRNVEHMVFVNYKTRPGSARADEHFLHIEGSLKFEPGECHKEVYVTVAKGVDEEFYLDLIDAATQETLATATLVIVNDSSDPGVIRFEEAEIPAVESLKEDVVDIIVLRTSGAAGKVSCAWRTEDHTAKADLHYKQASGLLEFEHGQMMASFPVHILSSGRFENTDMVRVILSNISGGAKFDSSTDGGTDHCISYVIIHPDPASQDRIARIHSAFTANWKKAKEVKSPWTVWKKQILDSFNLEDDDDDDDEEDEEAAKEGADKGAPGADENKEEESKSGGLRRYVKLGFTAVIFTPWKIVCAILLPPPDFCDGWLCFVSSLVAIGGITAIVGDMANLLGCVREIPDSVTAITLVALGTSVPDTFASKIAAEQDPHADASVGNVTGSNSVNVFLGLGLPWSMGALYWTLGKADSEWNARYAGKDFAQEWLEGAFVVEAGELAFSVIVFSTSAFACLALLAWRRRTFGGELGGPRKWARCSSALLVLLWALYVGVSCWHSLRKKK